MHGTLHYKKTKSRRENIKKNCCHNMTFGKVISRAVMRDFDTKIDTPHFLELDAEMPLLIYDLR